MKLFVFNATEIGQCRTRNRSMMLSKDRPTWDWDGELPEGPDSY